jgi:hypothetical protein
MTCPTMVICQLLLMHTAEMYEHAMKPIINDMWSRCVKLLVSLKVNVEKVKMQMAPRYLSRSGNLDKLQIAT